MLLHALAHEHVGAVLYDECPAHHLCPDVEKLRHHALAVVAHARQLGQRGAQALVCGRVAVLGHLGQAYQYEQRYDHDANEEVGLYEHVEVLLLQHVELLVGQRQPFSRGHGVHPRLDKGHGNIHSGQCAYRVERLSHVEAPRCRLLAAHAIDVGVAAGFEKRQAARHHEVGQQERGVHPHGLGREEQQCPGGIQRQPHEHSGLERIPPYEHGGWERHHEIAQVEGHLHHCALGDAHPEYL